MNKKIKVISIGMLLGSALTGQVVSASEVNSVTNPLEASIVNESTALQIEAASRPVGVDITKNIEKNIYNANTLICKIIGTITYQHNADGTVTIKSWNISRTNTGYNNYDRPSSAESGNPAKLTYNFAVEQKIGYSVANIPYVCYIKVANDGTITYNVPGALKD